MTESREHCGPNDCHQLGGKVSNHAHQVVVSASFGRQALRFLNPMAKLSAAGARHVNNSSSGSWCNMVNVRPSERAYRAVREAAIHLFRRESGAWRRFGLFASNWSRAVCQPIKRASVLKTWSARVESAAALTIRISLFPFSMSQRKSQSLPRQSVLS
jgi:hypothetical protein